MVVVLLFLSFFSAVQWLGLSGGSGGENMGMEVVVVVVVRAWWW